MTTKTKPRRGRPPLPPDEVRTDVIKFRLRPAEAARVREIAAGAGVSEHEWARTVVLQTSEGDA